MVCGARGLRAVSGNGATRSAASSASLSVGRGSGRRSGGRSTLRRQGPPGRRHPLPWCQVHSYVEYTRAARASAERWRGWRPARPTSGARLLGGRGAAVRWGGGCAGDRRTGAARVRVGVPLAVGGPASRIGRRSSAHFLAGFGTVPGPSCSSRPRRRRGRPRRPAGAVASKAVRCTESGSGVTSRSKMRLGSEPGGTSSALRPATPFPGP